MNGIGRFVQFKSHIVSLVDFFDGGERGRAIGSVSS